MAFDFARARVVLFGGQAAFGVIMNDTWEWDGSAWQPMPTAVAPTPRIDFAMTTDPFHGGVLVQGGSNAAVLFGDLWRWSGSQWLLQDSAGPLRRAHSMAIDPHHGDLVLFGGSSASATVHGDTWLWNGTWRQASVAGPSPRMGHRMTCDLVRNRVVMSGGRINVNTFVGNAETWIFDGQLWFRLGDGPARFDHVLDYDVVHGRCVEAGGSQSNALDVWSFGGAAAGTLQPFGQGCGSSTTPTMDAFLFTAPRLGTPLQLSTHSTPGATVYLLGFSASHWNTISLPVDLTPLGAPACVLYVEPAMIDVAVPVTGSAGWTAHTYGVPNDSALVGVQFFAQALTADPAANPAGIAMSNALAGTIGP
jgi:hypothetical protein